MNVFSLKTLLIGASVAALSGCYVVPISQYPAAGQPGAAGTVVPTGGIALGARLYPANDAASALGVLNASIVNQMDGRGVFSVNIAGEQYSGEATRTGQTRNGTANAAGNRGGYMRCTYTMNNPAQGTGTCSLASGATFSMHIGQ